jgi:microcystin-dependent protein
MYKWKWVALLIAIIAAGPVGFAVGQIVPALPFQLQNNTVADATQVMANFNQLLNNVNTNAAKNGSNSDITALLGLTTPLAPGVGGTTTFTGGTSGGSANAQTVTPVVPSTFSLVVGSRVVFVAGFANTAAMTLNVAASGAKAVFRKTQLGPVTTAGGELNAGDVVEVIYDGTQFQLMGPPTVVGEIKDYTSTVAPAGHLIADGSCVSQTTYAALFSVYSVQWGSCGGGLFALPDTRGRVMAGQDLNAGRLNAGGSNCGTGGTAAMTAACGAQNEVINQNNLPAVTWPNTLGVTRGGAVALSAAAGGVLNNQGVGGGANVTGGGGAYNIGAITVVDTQTFGVSGGVTSGGSGSALITVQPTLVVNKIIKY